MLTHKKGFTLVEIIVVLVLLSFLSVIVIPTYLSFVRDAQEKLCKVERSEMQRHYFAYHLLDSSKSIYDYVKDNSAGLVSVDRWGIALITGVCPSKGSYEFFVDQAFDEMQLYCYTHTAGTNSVAGISRSLFTMYHKLSKEAQLSFLKKYFPDKKNNYLSNDEFRYMVMSELGGKWVTLDSRVLNSLSTKYENLYLQPYIIPETGEVIVYANKKSDNVSASWEVNLYYDYRTGRWFEYIKEKSTYSIAGFNTQGTSKFHEDLKDPTLFREVIVNN